MLTGLRVRDFKRLDEVDIELGQLVFMGPYNSGKMSAQQTSRNGLRKTDLHVLVDSMMVAEIRRKWSRRSTP